MKQILSLLGKTNIHCYWVTIMRFRFHLPCFPQWKCRLIANEIKREKLTIWISIILILMLINIPSKFFKTLTKLVSKKNKKICVSKMCNFSSSKQSISIEEKLFFLEVFKNRNQNQKFYLTIKHASTFLILEESLK